MQGYLVLKARYSFCVCVLHVRSDSYMAADEVSQRF